MNDQEAIKTATEKLFSIKQILNSFDESKEALDLGYQLPDLAQRVFNYLTELAEAKAKIEELEKKGVNQ